MLLKIVKAFFFGAKPVALDPPRMWPWVQIFGVFGGDGIASLRTGKFWTIHRRQSRPVVDWPN